MQVEELEEKLSDQTQEVERLRSELVRLHLDVLLLKLLTTDHQFHEPTCDVAIC